MKKDQILQNLTSEPPLVILADAGKCLAKLVTEVYIVSGVHRTLTKEAFAEEYAWLAGPYKKIQEVNLLYKSSNEHLDDEQIKYIGDLLSSLGLEDYKSTFIV